MILAYRTDTSVIDELSSEVTQREIEIFRKKKKDYKKVIRPFVIPTDGIVKGDTLKEQYFRFYRI